LQAQIIKKNKNAKKYWQKSTCAHRNMKNYSSWQMAIWQLVDHPGKGVLKRAKNASDFSGNIECE